MIPTTQPCNTERVMRIWIVVVIAVATVSCGASPPMVFLTRTGCKNSNTMRVRLDEALQALGRIPSYTLINSDALPADDARRGYGTPTILINNRDLFGMSERATDGPPT